MTENAKVPEHLRYPRDYRDCPHENTVDVVGCLAEGGVAEGWECRDCGYHTW